jgi:hypothetical protein
MSYATQPEAVGCMPLAAKRAKRDRLCENLLACPCSWLFAFRRDPEPQEVIDLIASQGEFALTYFRYIKNTESIDPSIKSEFAELFRLSVEIGHEEYYSARSSRPRPHWWNWHCNSW